MLDPLTALSLASTVVQFVDFGLSILTGAVELYQSAKDALPDTLAKDAIYQDLKRFGDDLNMSSLPVNSKELLENEKDLRELIVGCEQACTELIKAFEKMKLGKGKSKWKSCRVALTTAWGKDDIDKMEKKLQNYRQQIQMRLIASNRLFLLQLQEQQDDVALNASVELKAESKGIKDHSREIAEGYEARLSGQITAFSQQSTLQQNEVLTGISQLIEKMGIKTQALDNRRAPQPKQQRVDSSLYPDWMGAFKDLGKNANQPLGRINTNPGDSTVSGPEGTPTGIGSCKESLHLVQIFASSPVAGIICAKYRQDDSLKFPSLSSQPSLAHFLRSRNQCRSFDTHYLQALVQEYEEGDSTQYNQLIAAYSDLHDAFLQSRHALATLGFLWIFARVIGSTLFDKLYWTVAIGLRPTRPDLQPQKLDALHQSLKFFLCTTDHPNWWDFKDAEADIQVPLWCSFDDGEVFDICKPSSAFGLLLEHQKPLLPVNKRALWVAETLIHLFGLGKVVENEKEDEIAREQQKQQNTFLWRCDPANAEQYGDDRENTSNSAQDWRAFPLVLGGTRESTTARAQAPIDIIDFKRAIREIVAQYENSPNPPDDLESVISFRLVFGRRDGTTFKGGIENRQVYFGDADEKNILLTSAAASTWTKRFLKTALSFNRALILHRQLGRLANGIFTKDSVIPFRDLIHGTKEFKLLVGNVSWHFLRGSHSETNYDTWYCLQTGRLLWDIPAVAIQRGAEICCDVSAEFGQLAVVTAVDAVMILSFIACIGMEYEQGISVPIPVWKEAMEGGEWQTLLPLVSEQIQARECAQGFLRPVEEGFPPFELDFMNARSPGCVFLARRSHLKHVTSPLTDVLGLTWRNVQFDVQSWCSYSNPSQNMVLMDNENRVHIFSIGSLSQNFRINFDAARAAGAAAVVSPEISLNNADSWELLLEKLGVSRMIHNPQQSGNTDETQRSDWSVHSQEVTRDVDEFFGEMGIHDGQHAQASNVPGGQLSKTEPAGLHGYPEVELQFYEVFILKKRESAETDLSVALLPHLQDQNLDPDEMEASILRILAEVVETLRDMTRDEMERSWIEAKILSSEEEYTARFRTADLQWNAKDIVGVYLSFIEHMAKMDCMPLDEIVLTIVGCVIKEQFVIYYEDYSIDGLLRLKRGASYGDPDPESLTWILKRANLDFTLLVHRTAVTQELASAWDMQRIVDNSDNRPKNYMFMLGLSVMSFFDPDGLEFRVPEGDLLIRGASHFFLASVSNGFSANQRYHLAHTDFFRSLDDVIRQPGEGEETARRGNSESREQQLSSISAEFEDLRQGWVRAMDMEKAVENAVKTARLQRGDHNFVEAIDTLTTVIRDALEYSHANPRLPLPSVIRQTVQACKELSDLFRKIKCIPQSYSFIGLQSILVDAYRVRDESTEPKIKHQVMQTAWAAERAVPEVYRSEFMTAGLEEAERIFQERSAWFERRMPGLRAQLLQRQRRG